MAALPVSDVGHAFSLHYWDIQTFCAFAVNVRTVSKFREKREHVDLVDTPKHLILVYL